MTTHLPLAHEDKELRRLVPPLIADLTIEGEDAWVDLEVSLEAQQALVRSLLKALAWSLSEVRDIATMEPEQTETQMERILQKPQVQNALRLRLDHESAKILATTLDAAEYEPQPCIVEGCDNLALPLAEWCSSHVREERF